MIQTLPKLRETCISFGKVSRDDSNFAKAPTDLHQLGKVSRGDSNFAEVPTDFHQLWQSFTR